MPGGSDGKTGTLFLVSGPCGAGKDCLIEGVRRRLSGDPGWVFPLRSVTRIEGFGGEVHIAVTPAQFDRQRRQGLFALYWGAGGVNYAIPISIGFDLAAGRSVVVNAPLCTVVQARARYPRVVAVWVSASPELRRQRLSLRGRESLDEIEDSLRFAEEPPSVEDVEILLNEGRLEASVDDFVALLRSYRNMVAPVAPLGVAECRKSFIGLP